MNENIVYDFVIKAKHIIAQSWRTLANIASSNEHSP